MTSMIGISFGVLNDRFLSVLRLFWPLPLLLIVGLNVKIMFSMGFTTYAFMLMVSMGGTN